MRFRPPGVPIHPEKEPVMTKETRQDLLTAIRELTAAFLCGLLMVMFVFGVICGPSLLTETLPEPAHHTTLLAHR